jgi:DNA adenine methylase
VSSEQSLLPGAPILRWAGSKRALVDRISGYWRPEYYRYVEPFAGSCALFFRLAPNKALLADKNHHLMELYQVLREDPDRLYRYVSQLKVGAEAYYRIRRRDPRSMSRVERAARFLYLNRFCFNGIYRTNREGRFNVPYSEQTAGGIPSLDHFCHCALLLRDVELRSWDFGTTLRYVRSGDFVYLDPPYAVKVRRVFREYGPRPFGSHDLERLSDHLVKLDERGAIFVVSYADCKEIRECARRWRVVRVAVKRNVAGFVGARRKAYEVLVTNGPLESKECR